MGRVCVWGGGGGRGGERGGGNVMRFRIFLSRAPVPARCQQSFYSRHFPFNLLTKYHTDILFNKKMYAGSNQTK